MNPQFEQPQGLRLPQPSLESASARPGSERQRQTEQQRSGTEVAAPLIPAPAPIPAVSAGAAAQTQIMQDMPAVTAPTAGDGSDDSGLDEEWIDKAKQIVDMTHADPYRQSNELSKFKADYLKIRHNKTIKIAEDRPK